MPDFKSPITVNGAPVLAGAKSMSIYTIPGTLSAATGAIRVYNALGRTVTISKVLLSVGTAPSGSALIVDINKGGTTIFTTQSNRPQVAVGSNTGETTTIEVNSWADGEYLTIDVDQAGTNTANLTVHIVYS